jgi:hypothetical protein
MCIYPFELVFFADMMCGGIKFLTQPTKRTDKNQLGLGLKFNSTNQLFRMVCAFQEAR